MVKTKNIFKRRKLVSFLAVIAGLLAGTFLYVRMPDNFDEAEWAEMTHNLSPESLYQDNYDDHSYQHFNPWMDFDISFMELLKWKLGPELEYSEEEKHYRPLSVANAFEQIKDRNDDYIL